MRHADLTRPHLVPSADQRRHRCAVMGIAKRPRPADAAAFQGTCNARYHRRFQRFGRSELRQDTRQATCHQRLACARWSHHQQVVASGCGDLQRTLSSFLPLHLAQICRAMRNLHDARLWRGKRGIAFEVVEQTQKVRGGDDLHLARPGCFRSLSDRADEAQLFFASM